METNRDYFSWSQYSLWKSSKLQFYKRYVLGEGSPQLPAFEKGKEFSNYRETAEIPHFVDDPLLTTVSRAIPKIGICEHKILTDFNDKKLLAYIDEISEDHKVFNEYKTGKIPWDQIQVENHKQLDFYALIIYLEYDIIPECNLYWIETEEIEIGGEKKLMYTGHVEKFVKKFTIESLENIGVKIYSTILEIKDYVHEEIPLDEEEIERYIYLTEQQKEINNELNLIKLRVLDDLNSFGAKYAASSKGRFSISKRKTPIYSNELLTKEKNYKKEIDQLKAKEKDSPDIKYTESESLRFNLIK